MGLGLDVRLSRLFSHTSGNLFGIAVDHFVGYGNVREGGLSNLPEAVTRCVSAGPDTMTMTPGTAKSCWPPRGTRRSAARPEGARPRGVIAPQATTSAASIRRMVVAATVLLPCCSRM